MVETNPDAGPDAGADERGPDEELPQSHRREHPRLRRASGPVLVLVVLGVLIAAFVTVRSGSDDPNAVRTATRTVSGPPTPTRTPTAPVRSAPTPGLPASVGRIAGPAPGDAAACPRTGSCRTLDTVPAATLRAVRAVFPGVRQRYASTVLTDTGLHFRQLNVGAGSSLIFLQVREATAADNSRSFADDDGHARHLFVQIRSKGYVVQVYVVLTGGNGLLADATGLRTVQRLAADRRLLAT